MRRSTILPVAVVVAILFLTLVAVMSGRSNEPGVAMIGIIRIMSAPLNAIAKTTPARVNSNPSWPTSNTPILNRASKSRASIPRRR